MVDLTHDLPPGDIRGGAFALAASHRFFPKGTIHVAVVDPGVGSRRRAIAVQTAKGVFVGPDNGVLSWALAKEKVRAIHALENEAYFLQPVSRTFHGRDIFAPVAAHLSRGVPIQKLGPALKDFVRLDWPEPRVRRGGFEGEVVYIDRFGNAITNLEGRLRGGFWPGLVRGPCKAPPGLPAENLLSSRAAEEAGCAGGLKRLPGDRRERRFRRKGPRCENRHSRGASRGLVERNASGGRASTRALILLRS